jgi:hypothetical protein
VSIQTTWANIKGDFMNQLSDMIGALEINAANTVLDDSALEYASAIAAAGPTSMNAGCKNSVFVCIDTQATE